MKTNEEDEQGEFIESSQTPTLRSKIRQKRPNYCELSKGKDIKMPPKRVPRDNRTVSQCIRRVWKNRRNKQSSTTSKQQQQQPAACVANAETFARSLQETPPKVGGIEPVPSISLFAQQEDALTRYMNSEAANAQVDEQLQKLLDGFQAEYKKECATMKSSPVHAMMEEHEAGSLHSILLPGAKCEKVAKIQENKQPAAFSPPQPFISEQFLVPNLSEEIARLEEMVQYDGMSPLRTCSVTVESMDTPIIPIVELREEMPQMLDKVPIVTNNVYLDLSGQEKGFVSKKVIPAKLAQPKAVIDDNEWLNVRKKRSRATSPIVFQQPDDVLELRMKHQHLAQQKVTNPSILSHRPFARSTSDCSTQTRFRRRYRNVGIQHRPVTSLDFTERNMIVLAQRFEADPIMLERKLRRVAQTACDPIWHVRDLSSVFTAADPYFANLKHFL
ncbi:uncharacterized protein LOC126562289 [Anopheles maculipalpis]|uniref:uncharacterized protein LOC126562289 n=1 Tax=Anopheles maculipalpis TaxID=1496333 RepID=UPI0021594756|nr:uncharacterized protein LOC126562289 [Anopheles maculipalpis]